ncbi:MAG: hypothetical protein WCJ64_26380 [Rhodospirillaceae bacterium]
MITEADVIAIRRAHTTASKDAALAELRRRFMHISEPAAPGVLMKVLRLPVAPPPEFRVHGDPVLDCRRTAPSYFALEKFSLSFFAKAGENGVY